MKTRDLDRLWTWSFVAMCVRPVAPSRQPGFSTHCSCARCVVCASSLSARPRTSTTHPRPHGGRLPKAPHPGAGGAAPPTHTHTRPVQLNKALRDTGHVKQISPAHGARQPTPTSGRPRQAEAGIKGGNNANSRQQRRQSVPLRYSVNCSAATLTYLPQRRGDSRPQQYLPLTRRRRRRSRCHSAREQRGVVVCHRTCRRPCVPLGERGKRFKTPRRRLALLG